MSSSKHLFACYALLFDKLNRAFVLFKYRVLPRKKPKIRSHKEQASTSMPGRCQNLWAQRLLSNFLFGPI